MKTIIIGFDAFDPLTFERLSEQGKLPNLSKYVAAGGYSRFTVVAPPQTEVSWTSIATGTNPGGHGIFDFVHRDPSTYTPYISLLPTKQGALGTQFVPPYKARTIFEEATRQGFPATVFWWPALFPARPELPMRTFPGLGTPDIQGRWGVGTLFTTDPDSHQTRVVPGDQKPKDLKTQVLPLEARGKDEYTGRLQGPVRKKGKGTEQTELEFHLSIQDEHTARLKLGKQSVDLRVGQWSSIIEIGFKVGRWMKVHALTRVILSQTKPDIKLYMLPLQLHPLHAPWRYATPGGFVKKTWKTHGPFLTLGWPQDTTALEENCIDDQQFLDLCDSIFDARERILMQQLGHFGEGILATVFDSLDRIQHMFRRDRPDIVDATYVKLDALIGRVQQRISSDKRAKLVIVSDHGFTNFDHKINLNRWLIDRGYLIPKESSIENASGGLQDVDWSRTQAYAVGLNSMYVNLAGREGQGAVKPDQYEALVNKLHDELLAWRGEDGTEKSDPGINPAGQQPVIQSVLRQDEAFQGPLTMYGPDLVLGFAPGYRASADTGLGKWGPMTTEANHDHWGADHCIDSQMVPGVLFCNQGLADFPEPSYRDIPMLTIGTTLESGDVPPPPSTGKEDEKTLEERLKGLGYL